MRWGDLGGWLDEVSVEVALVELARWLGMALAAYVIVVAVLVLLGELAATVRAVPLARLLRRVAGVVAVPALRRRLVEASTATAITVSAMSATVGRRRRWRRRRWWSRPSTAARRRLRWWCCRRVSPGDVVGFGYDPATVPCAMRREVRVVVAPGDTVWDLAVAHYGFCDRSIVELVAAASGLEDPNLIFVGQVLVLPPLPVAPPVPTAPADAVVPADAATWSAHTIVVGDTLWDILEGHYGFVDGRSGVGGRRLQRLEDPSDIPVGTVVTLPPLAGADRRRHQPRRRTPPPSAAARRVSRAPVVAPAPAAPVAEAPAVEPVPRPRSSAASPTAAPRPARRRRLTPATPTRRRRRRPIGEAGASVAPWLVGLAGATTLSAGLLAVYRRLRRRQTAAGARAWRLMPSGESARLHRQLVAAADLPLVRWAGQEMSGVLFGLGRPAAGPVAVELSDLTGIELLWDAPMPEAPAPWEATPGGWSWRLLYDPAAEVPESVLPAAVPGLVTLGRRDDAQVLVDLEAFGSVSIGGDARAAEDVMRAVVLELGAGEELSDAWVSTVGLGVDGVEHLARVQARSDDEALRHAGGIVADQRRVMDDAGVEGTFVLRASGPAGGPGGDGDRRAGRVVRGVGRAGGVGDAAFGVGGGCPRRRSTGPGCGSSSTPTARWSSSRWGWCWRRSVCSHEAAANTAVLLDAAAEQLMVEDLDRRGGARPTSVVGDADRGRRRRRRRRHLRWSRRWRRCAAPTGSIWSPPAICCDGDDERDDDGTRPGCGSGRRRRCWCGCWASRGWSRSRRDVRARSGWSSCTWRRRAVRLRRARCVTPCGGRRWSPTSGSGTWWAQSGRSWARRRCPVRATGPRSELVRLEDTVTDLQLLEAMAAQAEQVPSTEALALLVEGLGWCTGEPFDDVGYEWAIDRAAAVPGRRGDRGGGVAGGRAGVGRR